MTLERRQIVKFKTTLLKSLLSKDETFIKDVKSIVTSN
jgi:hypothetical protein